jgi:hypothetical protein
MELGNWGLPVLAPSLCSGNVPLPACLSVVIASAVLHENLRNWDLSGRNTNRYPIVFNLLCFPCGLQFREFFCPLIVVIDLLLSGLIRLTLLNLLPTFLLAAWSSLT